MPDRNHKTADTRFTGNDACITLPVPTMQGERVNSKEPAQALQGRESACPVCASSMIQPGKSHCRELAGPEDGRIYYVSNVPGYR
jgi:hypothetical protein